MHNNLQPRAASREHQVMSLQPDFIAEHGYSASWTKHSDCLSDPLISFASKYGFNLYPFTTCLKWSSKSSISMSP
ncbi:hypothetical protein HanXRQr2_Chr17g0827601 [Helianthus annuus]|uniref:Uncharacterized protein n=1 Tax=Helianthus annuus TaxID=4232 RepID=A0A9K3GWH9_HELAN|nr:hypothetical protein HanXRQr2_Chr17g0827601 [Helianthus annuus]